MKDERKQSRLSESTGLRKSPRCRKFPKPPYTFLVHHDLHSYLCFHIKDKKAPKKAQKKRVTTSKHKLPCSSLKSCGTRSSGTRSSPTRKSSRTKSPSSTFVPRLQPINEEAQDSLSYMIEKTSGMRWFNDSKRFEPTNQLTNYILCDGPSSKSKAGRSRFNDFPWIDRQEEVHGKVFLLFFWLL